MVSFQCDACTDVVKKPKLDRHYGQCQASFTCIDCSATFAGPSQWKNHTSCITEAEKYQKSLYKGSKKGQVSGNHRNTQPEVAKIPGKYHQSQSNQRSWSRPQYVPNYVSGANTTPLRSPPRMSPVDASAIDSSVNAAKTEREVGKRRDSEVLVEAPTSNAGQQKIGIVSELPQEPPSVVNGSTERQRKSKKSKEGPKPETQTSPKESASEKDRDEKKSKKRKRKEADGDGPNAVKQPDTHLEATHDKSKDEKKAKKRKSKEKRDDVSPLKQNDVADEETRMELEATDVDEVKERAKKKKKSKDKKASAEKAPVSDEVTGGEKRKKRKKNES